MSASNLWNRIMNVAAYYRSSKERKDVSISSQKREIGELIVRNGDALVAEFSDEARSAKSDDRPGFQAMITEAQKKRCRFKQESTEEFCLLI